MDFKHSRCFYGKITSMERVGSKVNLRQKLGMVKITIAKSYKVKENLGQFFLQDHLISIVFSTPYLGKKEAFSLRPPTHFHWIIALNELNPKLRTFLHPFPTCKMGYLLDEMVVTIKLTCRCLLLLFFLFFCWELQLNLCQFNIFWKLICSTYIHIFTCCLDTIKLKYILKLIKWNFSSPFCS